MSNSESEDKARNSSDPDDDWTPDKPKKKSALLRKSLRVFKKAKTYTSSEDDTVAAQAQTTHRNGVKKKKPGRPPGSETAPGKKNYKCYELTRTPIQAPTTFTSGAFVVAKNDAQSYDSGAPPHIWRIDGKALLQKFEPIEIQAQLRYKNTSVYTGWSEMETDNYAVLKNIDFIYNTPQRVEIMLNVDEFKNVLMNSD